METIFEEEKTRTRVQGKIVHIEGVLAALQGKEIDGYEIHMGNAHFLENKKYQEMNQITDHVSGESKLDGYAKGNVYGTYIHGFFDMDEIASGVIQCLAKKKGVSIESVEAFDYKAFKETQYDILAKNIREHVDMKEVYRILEEGV